MLEEKVFEKKNYKLRIAGNSKQTEKIALHSITHGKINKQRDRETIRSVSLSLSLSSASRDANFAMDSAAQRTHTQASLESRFPLFYELKISFPVYSLGIYWLGFHFFYQEEY